MRTLTSDRSPPALSEADITHFTLHSATGRDPDLIIERYLVDDDPPAALCVPEPHGLDILDPGGAEGALMIVPVLPAVGVTRGVVAHSRVGRVFPGVGLLRPLAAEEGVLVQGGLEASERELLVLQTAGEPGH